MSGNKVESQPKLNICENDEERKKAEDLELSGSCLSCFPRKLCHPSYGLHRFVGLVLVCLLGFGSEFCYDNPGALQNQIVADMEINIGSFSQLYSWCFWPNSVLSFFGGFLIDRIGIRLGTILFSGLILIGQLVFAGGAIFKQFWLMIVGRLIYGIGGESLNVAQNTYTAYWFSQKELNMVFGVQMSIAEVGSTVNFVTMVQVYQLVNTVVHGNLGLGVTLAVASIFCLLSLFCALVLAFFDKRSERLLNKRTKTQTKKVVNITDAKHFCLSYWLICLVCVTYYVTIFPFTALESEFFEHKYKMSQEWGNLFDSIIYLVAAILAPLLGLLIDYTGRNLTWLFGAMILTLTSHYLLTFTYIHPLIVMIQMGCGYSIVVCSLWPLVALVIPEHLLGTGYGIMNSILTLGLGTAIMAAGYIVDLKGYLYLELFFMGWICLCLAILTFLYVVDKRSGGLLNISAQQRQECQRQSDQSRTESIERNNNGINGIIVETSKFNQKIILSVLNKKSSENFVG